jgi:hypothetical protein
VKFGIYLSFGAWDLECNFGVNRPDYYKVHLRIADKTVEYLTGIKWLKQKRQKRVNIAGKK